MEITIFEIQRTVKTKFFFLIGGIIGLSMLLNNPVLNEYWPQVFAVKTFVNDVRMLTMFSVPLLVAFVFNESGGKLTDHILYSQPVSLKKIAKSKFLAILAIYGFWIVVSMLVFVFSPVVIGKPPYDLFTFIGGVGLVVLPILLFFGLFSSILYIMNPNLIALYVLTLCFIVLLGYLPPVLDISLKNKQFYEMFAADFTQHSLLLTNRIITCLVILLLFFIFLRQYAKSLDQKKGKFLFKKLNFSFHTLTKKILGKQSAMLAPGIILILGVLLVLSAYAVVMNDFITWGVVNYLFILLPSIYLIPCIVEIYENKRAGYLFTSITPKHILLRQRFIYGLSVSYLVMSLLFLSAYLKGLESDPVRIFTLLIPSLFIALAGMTAANLAKKRVIGYIVALALWLVPLIGGSKLSEQIWFAAPYLPVSTYGMLLWESLFAMILFSALLYSSNLFILSKNELNRKETAVSLVICLFIVLVTMIPAKNPDNRFFTKTDQLVETVYHDETVFYDGRLPKSLAVETIKKMNFTVKQLTPYFSELAKVRHYYIVSQGTTIDQTDTAFVYGYQYLREFNPSKYSSERPDFLVFTRAILTRFGLSDLPEYFQEGLANYLIYGVLVNDLDEITTPEYRARYYLESLNPEHAQVFRHKIQESSYPGDRFANILQEIEGKYGTKKINAILAELGDLKGEPSFKQIQAVFISQVGADQKILRQFDQLRQLTEK